MEYPIEGSCQCGQVTYKLFEPPKRVVACHCKECQKLSTSPFSVTAVIAADAINPLESETIKLKLKPTNLSDYSIFKPSAHVWVSEKQNWYQIPEGVKVFDKQP